jgi:hypothetical protein
MFLLDFTKEFEEARVCRVMNERVREGEKMAGRCCKTSKFVYVFLTREMLVHLVNFDK